MIFAVIDTNIFVSGLLNRQGAPGKIIDLLYEEKLFPVVTSDIYAEIERVLNYRKFDYSKEEKDEILGFLKAGIVENVSLLDNIEGLPDDDIKFVIAAICLQAECIITGNTRHFAAIADKIKIFTPADFIEKYFK